MLFTGWRSWLKKRLRSTKTVTRRRETRFVPQLLILEDRCLPANGILMPVSSVGTLSQVLWNGGPAFPGVTINPGQNRIPSHPHQ